MNTTPEPEISEYVAELRRWGEFEDSFPTLSVPYRERTLAQHLECWSIRDLNWKRLVFLGVRDVGAQLRACADKLGAKLDEKPSDELLRYLDRLLLQMYLDTHRERWAERDARERARAEHPAGGAR